MVATIATPRLTRSNVVVLVTFAVFLPIMMEREDRGGCNHSISMHNIDKPEPCNFRTIEMLGCLVMERIFGRGGVCPGQLGERVFL